MRLRLTPTYRAGTNPPTTTANYAVMTMQYCARAARQGRFVGTGMACNHASHFIFIYSSPCSLPTYIYSSAQRLCQPCQAATISSLINFGGLVVLAAAAALMYANIVNVPTHLRRWLLVGLFNRIDGGALRVLWSNYQSESH